MSNRKTVLTSSGVRQCENEFTSLFNLFLEYTMYICNQNGEDMCNNHLNIPYYIANQSNNRK